MYIGCEQRATLVDLKVVTGMLQMHRLRRAREDSKQFHALPRCLASPRLPEIPRLPAQTMQRSPLHQMSLGNPIFTTPMSVYGVRTCVSHCALLGKLRQRYAMTAFGRANHSGGDQSGLLSPKIGEVPGAGRGPFFCLAPSRRLGSATRRI